MNDAIRESTDQILLQGLYEAKTAPELASSLGLAFQTELRYLTLADYLYSLSLHARNDSMADLLPSLQSPVLRMIHDGDFTVHEQVLNDRTSIFFQVVAENRIPFAIIILIRRNDMKREDAHYIVDSLSKVCVYLSQGDMMQSSLNDSMRASLGKLLLDSKKHPSTFYTAVQNIYSEYHYDLSPFYAVAAFSLAEKQKAEALIASLSNTSELFGKNYSHQENDLLIVLFCALPYSNDRFVWDTFREQLMLFAKSHNAICAVSLPFNSLEFCYEYKTQAQNALLITRYRECSTGAYFTEDFLPDTLLAGILKNIDHEELILSDIEVLAKHDRNNNTKMLSTLDAYLRNYGRTSSTAKELFIDRSTLKYRIKQISEIIQEDLENRDVQARLKMAIHIYKIVQAADTV